MMSDSRPDRRAYEALWKWLLPGAAVSVAILAFALSIVGDGLSAPQAHATAAPAARHAQAGAGQGSRAERAAAGDPTRAPGDGTGSRIR